MRTRVGLTGAWRASSFRAVPLRAFPVLYAKDVERVADFYARLGFEEHFRMPGEDGAAGFIGLRREVAELAVVTEDSPRALAGVEPGPGPRHELFVYVDDVDATLRQLDDAGATVLREPDDMPWGERLAFVRDPEGNVVTLAMPAD
jgi:lactoylglutathione lyase